MKVFCKDKKAKNKIRKLAVIKHLKHNELINTCQLPQKNDKTKFRNFEINELILKALDTMNFIHATEIQAKILPHALNFKDIIASEKTGSGKTLAYLIPLLNLVLKFRFRNYHGTCAIVLVPTKELCIQVCSIFSQLSQFCNVKYEMIHSDDINKDQKAKLALGCTVLFCTPGALLQHMKCSLETKEKENIEYFRYHNLKFLVLDEADRLLEDSFKSTISKILDNLPPKRQTMVLSATLDLNSASIEDISTLSPSFVSININLKSCKNVNKNATADNLIEGYVILSSSKRIMFLYSLVKEIKDKKVMIFFSSSAEVEFYYSFLSLLNINNKSLLMLHSNLTSDTRMSNLLSFNNQKSGILLCTDVVARGMDIPDVSLIVQFDIPADSTAYIHRVGRTARNGLEGTAILLLRPDESEKVLSCLSSVSKSMIEFETPHLHEINNFFEQLPPKSELFQTARKALISQIKAYKNSELIESVDHLKIEDEIINFCLKEAPKKLKIRTK